jgi:XTP/dITP diphosphohydrolase
LKASLGKPFLLKERSIFNSKHLILHAKTNTMILRLVFATHNTNKAREIQSIMPNGVEILSLEDIGCDEDIPETGDTLTENALIKARYVHKHYGLNCFADDTGLEVSALNNEPGVYSARYAGPERDANANMDLLLLKLSDHADRTARFKTCIALIIHGEETLFEGSVDGRIGTDKLGSEGFGYDPIFYPEASTRTFAEMTLDEKSEQSHRARAFKKMIAHLNAMK